MYYITSTHYILYNHFFLFSAVVVVVVAILSRIELYFHFNEFILHLRMPTENVKLKQTRMKKNRKCTKNVDQIQWQKQKPEYILLWNFSAACYRYLGNASIWNNFYFPLYIWTRLKSLFNWIYTRYKRKGGKKQHFKLIFSVTSTRSRYSAHFFSLFRSNDQ